MPPGQAAVSAAAGTQPPPVLDGTVAQRGKRRYSARHPAPSQPFREHIYSPPSRSKRLRQPFGSTSSSTSSTVTTPISWSRSSVTGTTVRS
jgi:hypothetical protein